MTTTAILVTLDGSHGTLIVHRSTGTIVKRKGRCRCEDCGGAPYGNIGRIDPASFQMEPERDHFDVLEAGFWTPKGDFEPGLTMRTASGWFPRYGGGRVWLDDDFDDWVPLALLPAPAPTPDARVIAHAWHWENDATDGVPYQTYSDPGCDPVDGWCIYRRIPDPRGDHWPFAVQDEADFATRDEAVTAARLVADVYGATLCVED
jgi:hypothetical protein